MKKIITYITLLFCLQFTGYSYAQVIKFLETFENPDAENRGWKFINNDGNMAEYPVLRGAFTFTDAGYLYPHAGNYFINYNSLNANDNRLIDEWVISPGIKIDKYDRLSFWCGAVDKSYKDTLRVLISVSGNNIQDFTEIDRFKVNGPSTAWHKISYDLSAYAGKTIYFAVNYFLKDGGALGVSSDNVWIDHFIVENLIGPDVLVEKYELDQNFPNPFNPSTNIIFSLQYDSDVSITIYDALGKQTETFVNRNFKKGRYKFLWNGANYSSGVYFYKIRAVSGNNTFEDTKHMVLIK